MLHSAKWCSGLIERFLWQQAERGLSELEAAGEQPLCIWDGSVLEKAESEHLEGLAPVRSSKAKRLQRSRPGVFNKPGKPIVVRGWEWTAILLCGLKGAVQVVSMRWWSRKGEQATTAREQEGQLLRQCARRWGRRVLHLFDRGYAGGPWLGDLARQGVRFVMRWPKRYQLLVSLGVERKAWQIALGKRAWGAPRMIWDGQLRKLRQTSVVALPVRRRTVVTVRPTSPSRVRKRLGRWCWRMHAGGKSRPVSATAKVSCAWSLHACSSGNPAASCSCW